MLNKIKNILNGSKLSFGSLRKLDYKYYIGIAIVGIALVFGAIYILRAPKSAEAEWFNDSWYYRQSTAITNSGSAQTDFQIQVVVDTATLISAGKMQSDCDDIRFTDLNGNVLNYFLETECDSANTLVWVKMVSIPTTDSTIYLYYGNPSAQSDSNYVGRIEGINIGNGNDGAITVSANKNINTDNMISGRTCADGGDGVIYTVTANTLLGQNQITLSSTPASGCLAVGDEIMIINSQGTSSDYSNVGKYETVRITSIDTATLTLNHNLSNSYNGTTQKIVVQRVPNYTSVTVNAGFTLSASTWDGSKGGILAFRANGTVSIASTGSIDTSYDGFRGHERQLDNLHGWQGEGANGLGAQAISANSNGGGGGQHPYAAGGGGGYGTAGTDGMQESGSKGDGAGVIGDSQLTTIFFGGAGGRGGDNDGSGINVPSGDGGGIIFMTANAITVTGNIYSKGRNGYAAVSQDGGDGGGAGGAIYLKAPTITITGNVNAEGGIGTQQPSGNPGPLNGGDGGDGRIAIDYSSSLSGSATPGATTNQYPAASSPSSEEKGPGPVGYWSFDEGYGTTAYDKTSNSNDGTIVSATWQTEDMCISGKCLYFDGDGDDSANCGNDSSLDITSAITMEAWIKPTGQGESGTPRIMSKGTSGDRAYGFLINLNEGVNSLEAWIGSSYQSSNNNVVSLNSWQHVVVTYSSSSQDTNFYVNGINVGTSNGASLESSVNDLIIGDMPSGGRAFNGQIDEVKVYPYARTEAQILTDYNAGLAGVGSASGVSVAMGGGSNKSLSDGLVGYWKMDETTWDGTPGEVLDTSGNGNHGTSTNAIATSTAKFGNAGEFDGSSSYVDVSDGDSLDLTGDVTTFSVWTYWDTITGDHKILAKAVSAGSSSSAYQIRSDGSSGNLLFQIYNSVWGTATASGILDGETDKWIHLVVVLELDNIVKFYKNGVLHTTSSIDKNIPSSTGAFAIGKRYGGSPDYFDGLIDEVRIYNRALSSREVRQLYEWAPGPIGHWKMDEKVSGNSQTLYDISGNENNGTTYYGANTTGMDCTAIGKYGGGCEFDGVDDYVDISGLTTNLSNNDFTVSGWFKGTDSKYIVAQTHAIGGYASDWIFGGSGTELFWMRSVTLGTASTIEDNNWHHLVMVWDKNTETYEGFVDGNSIGTSGSVSGYGGINSVKIGVRGDATSSWANGLIDDVRIYNYARTQKQILEDMNGGRPAISSPIGYWSFDEGYGSTVKDSSGNDYDLTIGGASWTNNGKFGKALSFDGSDDYVTRSISTDSFDKASEGSISFWFLWDSSDTDDNAGLFAIIDTSTENNIFRMSLGNMTGTWNDESIRYEFYDNSSWIYNFAYRNGHTFYRDSQWHHVVFKVNEQGNTIYVDGEEKEVSTWSGSQSSSSWLDDIPEINNIYIGSTYYSASPYINLKGKIDEFKIYNYALTEDEVRQEYNQGKAIVLGSTGTESDGTTPSNSADRSYCVPGDTTTCDPPIAEWKFDEKTGDYAYDTSENNNTGTLTNMESSDWTIGKIGSGLDFDGDDEHIVVSSPTDAFVDDYTLSFWVYPETLSRENYFFSSSYDSASSILFYYDGSEIRFIERESSANTGFFDSDNIALNEDEWAYLTIQRSGTDLYLYVNGIQKATATSIGVDVSSVDYQIGYAIPRNKAGVYFDGKIDHVQIYDYARTPAQIAWDYNKGAPVGYWSFDEGEGSTTHDETDNLNHGTLQLGTGGNTVTSTAWQASADCKKGKCMDFDGTDDYVDMGNTNDVATNDFTISAWINTDVVTGNEHYIMAKRKSGAGGKGYLCIIDNVSGRMQAQIDDDNVAAVNWYGTTDVTDGEWHHVVCVADRNGNGNIYVDGFVDGTPVDISASNLTLTEPDRDCVVGVSNVTGSLVSYFNGQIDEVKIYNYALTPLQVQQDYNLGKGIYFK